jgi:hypothetical protein
MDNDGLLLRRMGLARGSEGTRSERQVRGACSCFPVPSLGGLFWSFREVLVRGEFLLAKASEVSHLSRPLTLEENAHGDPARLHNGYHCCDT